MPHDKRATPRGIPTEYRGTTYRSRIEARWAAFFDLAGWRYDYEPIDLDGYIPDFILLAPRGPILVEVKSSAYASELEHAQAKIDASGWADEAIIVGQSPRLAESLGDDVFGWIREPLDGHEPCWALARAVMCGHNHIGGFSSYDHTWRNRMCSCDQNKLEDWNQGHLEHLWSQASNSTQWRAPRIRAPSFQVARYETPRYTPPHYRIP